MVKALCKVEGGKLIKVQLVEKKGKIQKVRITGDFFLHPEETIDDLEQALIGKPLKAEIILETINDLTREKDVTLLGASPEDFARCILRAGGKNG